MADPERLSVEDSAKLQYIAAYVTDLSRELTPKDLWELPSGNTPPAAVTGLDNFVDDFVGDDERQTFVNARSDALSIAKDAYDEVAFSVNKEFKGYASGGNEVEIVDTLKEVWSGEIWAGGRNPSTEERIQRVQEAIDILESLGFPDSLMKKCAKLAFEIEGYKYFKRESTE